ncbi:glycoside hydrolase superfamily [Staphylotrichum tortipilum]|uniref:chitinase n=1 Tax=Staphylotrichum tortipilum TaxID=2831512 RepID=A0AAN6MTJ5_9PEZI|nr:glycoside hydrolase superfamily [Staphylotrichum longicolle]
MRSTALLFTSLLSLLFTALPGAAQECSATTAEFCNDRTVKRNSPRPMRRVVGYYEGWAARRIVCHTFSPEDIPVGAYSHLNFAFAGIDPVSFRVAPAHAQDVPLYSRLTALKQHDPALKVFISLGGRNFNSPGAATVHTFSQLAAGEAKQRVFFASLISFLNTYNFDGVDIDWEYPGDEVRGGSAADYANFPRFVRNLRSALDAGGAGHLQHFDIASLEQSIDFFNVKSYDLHGWWEPGSNTRRGAYLLNAHTNMTEITSHLDLFRRAGVSPDKVTLGLAFYARTFLAADPGCVAAGCAFDAVGPSFPCSRDDIGGTLTNAELTDVIRGAGVTPTLDSDAMVKVAVIGRRWIAYDDEDTFRLKVDAARELRLGGVMVWAVSQDYTAYAAARARNGQENGDGTAEAIYGTQYSEQLHRATLYSSPKAVDTAYVTTPAAVFELSHKDAQTNEMMHDGGQCQGGRVRHFCCPAAQTIPKCGWFGLHNGKCGTSHGSCPADVIGPAWAQREVGSTKAACGHDKAQVACCETRDEASKPLDSMHGYDACK